MRLLFYPCRKATELVEKRQVEPLRTTEALRLRAHLSMCRSCARYALESEALDQALTDLAHHPPGTATLTEAQKKQLIDTLEGLGN